MSMSSGEVGRESGAVIPACLTVFACNPLYATMLTSTVTSPSGRQFLEVGIHCLGTCGIVATKGGPLDTPVAPNGATLAILANGILCGTTMMKWSVIQDVSSPPVI